MTSTTREQKIEAYGAAHHELVAALATLPTDAWHYRPALDRWTIQEIVVHITDSEVNSYLRCRMAIAEPGSRILVYDEERWAQVLDYERQDAREALALFELLRRSTFQLIRALPPAAWGGTIEHAQLGTLTLDDWLDIYVRHVADHIEQMRENLADWQRDSAASTA